MAREKVNSLIPDDARIRALFDLGAEVAEKGVTTIHALDEGVTDPREVSLILRHQDQLPFRAIMCYQTTNISAVSNAFTAMPIVPDSCFAIL